MQFLCLCASYIEFWESRIYFVDIEKAIQLKLRRQFYKILADIQNFLLSFNAASFVPFYSWLWHGKNFVESSRSDRIELRSSHHLARRTYLSVGPNCLWNIDWYDKIKSFGFAIHGAIDGFSRKILWLRVASSNNNPKVITSYYMDCVR